MQDDRIRFAAGPEAPPRQRHGPASSLPLHGAARAHSFRARPARHLRSPSAARRRCRQHVGPHYRDSVRHPDLPVRGARSAKDGRKARSRPGPASPRSPRLRPGPCPSSSASHPSPDPARPRPGAPRVPQTQRPPRARPRRPPAHPPGGAAVTQAVCALIRRDALSWRGSECAPLRPAQLRPTGAQARWNPSPGPTETPNSGSFSG